MSLESVSFAAWQSAFAARIRDPRGAPRPPGAPAGRTRVYETMLLANLERFLLACYPVSRELMGVRAWRRTVRRFFAEHRCGSPLFRDIPAAFLAWLQDKAETLFPGLPFLTELMHYEWLELAVEIAPETIDPERIDPAGDLLDGQPVVNPTARLACYRYPVHRIGPRFRPRAADTRPHCYLLFRDGQDEVRFILLDPLGAQLIARLSEPGPTGREVLTRLAAEHAPGQSQLYLRAGTALLEGLFAQGALLGTWRRP